jgi:hypothetical protein
VIAHAPARHAGPRIAGQYRRLRSAHPVHVLRWLRNGVLLCVAAAALLYLWVANQADNDIAAVQRTQQTIEDINKASSAVTGAETELKTVFLSEDVTLVGTGSDFVNKIALVDQDLTLAAEGNAAGVEGTREIQFVHDQLVSYLELSENAVSDCDLSGNASCDLGTALGQAGQGYALSGETDVRSAIDELKGTEQGALDAQRAAWALDPGTFWWALLGPVIGMLLLVAATANVLARYFRRHVSRWLWGSLLITAATMVTAGFFNPAADPWARHTATMAAAMLLLLASAVLAQLAYRPRLAEYRFQPS